MICNAVKLFAVLVEDFERVCRVVSEVEALSFGSKRLYSAVKLSQNSMLGARRLPRVEVDAGEALEHEQTLLACFHADQLPLVCVKSFCRLAFCNRMNTQFDVLEHGVGLEGDDESVLKLMKSVRRVGLDVEVGRVDELKFPTRQVPLERILAGKSKNVIAVVENLNLRLAVRLLDAKASERRAQVDGGRDVSGWFTLSCGWIMKKTQIRYFVLVLDEQKSFLIENQLVQSLAEIVQCLAGSISNVRVLFVEIVSFKLFKLALHLGYLRVKLLAKALFTTVETLYRVFLVHVDLIMQFLPSSCHTSNHLFTLQVDLVAQILTIFAHCSS